MDGGPRCQLVRPSSLRQLPGRLGTPQAVLRTSGRPSPDRSRVDRIVIRHRRTMRLTQMWRGSRCRCGDPESVRSWSGVGRESGLGRSGFAGVCREWVGCRPAAGGPRVDVCDEGSSPCPDRHAPDGRCCRRWHCQTAVFCDRCGRGRAHRGGQNWKFLNFNSDISWHMSMAWNGYVPHVTLTRVNKAGDAQLVRTIFTVLFSGRSGRCITADSA